MVQKKAGRPRSFDRETALEAALNVFWAKGYDGASMADLTGAMGINKPSLYAAFGDKDALFAETIARYAERYFGGALQAFLSESSPEKAVHAALLAALEGATRADTEAVGCLLAVGAAPTAVSRPWIGEQ
ncbi:MAG: TetR/AcrR family transcriptional regulator, partial [Pseudomonadota bacterium]